MRPAASSASSPPPFASWPRRDARRFADQWGNAMSDVRHILEERRRAHQPDPGGFDRLGQRRTRRQRNQRGPAAGVALTLMAAAAYGAVIARREVRQGLRPAGPSI